MSHSSRRMLPLIDDMRESLLAHKTAAEANRKLFGRVYAKKDSEYKCVREDGNLIKLGL